MRIAYHTVDPDLPPRNRASPSLALLLLSKGRPSSKARGSAAMEAPLAETPVDVRFEALRGAKTHGLTPIHGDEGVLAPPPRVRHTLHFGNRFEFAVIQ